MWGKGKRESIPNLEVGYKFFPLARVGREEEGMGDFGSHQSAPVNTSEPENNHPTSQPLYCSKNHPTSHQSIVIQPNSYNLNVTGIANTSQPIVIKTNLNSVSILIPGNYFALKKNVF